MQPTHLVALGILVAALFGCRDGSSGSAPASSPPIVNPDGIAVSGDVRAGGSITVTVAAEPGTSVELGIEFDRGVPFIRRAVAGFPSVALRDPLVLIPMGTAGRDGYVARSFPLPTTIAPMTRILLQAFRQGASRSSTEPVLVRILPPGAIRVTGDHDTIQKAIDAASDGQVVVVDPGVYRGTITFRGKAIAVVSRDGVDQTTIDAEGRWPHAVRFESGEDARSRLEGFTIVGAQSHGVVCWSGASPTVTGNRIANHPGSGMYVQIATPITIENNVFENNRGTFGGGMHVQAGSVVITDCIVRDNYAWAPFGSRGGGIDIAAPMADFHSVIVEDNGCGGRASAGGGVHCSDSARFTNCIFRGNSATGTLGASGGGAQALGTATFVHCTFVDNGAFAGPASTVGGGAIAGTTSLHNCILWGNRATADAQVVASAFVTHSFVEGGFAGGVAVRDEEPDLTPEGRQRAGSPTIDAGTTVLPWPVPHDFEGDRRGARPDVGADEYPDSTG